VTPTVCIITHCPDTTYIYGTLLTVHTVRVGFPTARVFVLDNGSLPEAQSHIRQAAEQAEARVIQLTPLFSPPLPHWDVLRGLIQDEPPLIPQLNHRRGPLVILDADLLFWQTCESWQFEGLLAGRLIPSRMVVSWPTYPTPTNETALLLPRLHTSFWWIPDRRKLRQRILEIHNTHHTWNPFTPWMVPHPSGVSLWYIGDTASNLYGAIQKDCVPFTTAQLGCYDHLFAGSTPAIIAQLSAHPFPGYEWFPRVHAAAQQGDWSSIRGVWREQEAYFTATGAPSPSASRITLEQKVTVETQHLPPATK
jgi:hypothetical protein